MDETLRHFNPSPMVSANHVSKALFCWLNPLFKKGQKKELFMEDLYNVPDHDTADHLGASLEREWEKELRQCEDSRGKRKPSLLKVLARLFGPQYLMFGTILFTEEMIRVVQPLLLGSLIQFFTAESRVSETGAYLCALGVSTCTMVMAVTHHIFFFNVALIGMRMRIACCSLMFKKVLRLSDAGMSQTSTGHIVNLMSNDVGRFDKGVQLLHYLWIGPLQAVVVMVILWRELGASVVGGLVVLLLLIPVQGLMGRIFSKLRHKIAVHTDERVKVMNEIIAGIRVIKMYCWEKPFSQLVEKIRRGEVRWIRRVMALEVVRCFFDYLGDRLLGSLILIPFFLYAPEVRSRLVFVVLMYSNLLHRTCVRVLMEVMEVLASVRVASRRIQDHKSSAQPIELSVPSPLLPSIPPSLPPSLPPPPIIVSVSRPSSRTCHGCDRVFRSEMDYVWAKKLITTFTSNVWLFAHRILGYTVVVMHITLGGNLRATPLYIALSFMFLLAYNGIGCVFEGVSKFSEFCVASARIEVGSGQMMWRGL
ncbi:hypothetical protein ACOMHN_040389 [Nucella lapillus]